MFYTKGYETIFEKHDPSGELRLHLNSAAKSKTFGYYSANTIVGYESAFLAQVLKHI